MVPLVLIVSPHDSDRATLSRLFRQDGYRVVETDDPVDGLLALLRSDPDLVVLTGEGPEMLAMLRRLSDAPVIMADGGGDAEEAQALHQGADFYADRPSGRLILARAAALRRRYGPRGGLPPEDRPGAALTKTERRLLVYLLMHAGQPLSAERIVAGVWHGMATRGNVKFYISRLRRKLADSGVDIESLPGVGYRVRRATDAPVKGRTGQQTGAHCSGRG